MKNGSGNRPNEEFQFVNLRTNCVTRSFSLYKQKYNTSKSDNVLRNSILTVECVPSRRKWKSTRAHTPISLSSTQQYHSELINTQINKIIKNICIYIYLSILYTMNTQFEIFKIRTRFWFARHLFWIRTRRCDWSWYVGCCRRCVRCDCGPVGESVARAASLLCNSRWSGWSWCEKDPRLFPLRLTNCQHPTERRPVTPFRISNYSLTSHIIQTKKVYRKSFRI